MALQQWPEALRSAESQPWPKWPKLSVRTEACATDCCCANSTGMRRNELLNCLVGDLTGEEGRIFYRGRKEDKDDLGLTRGP